MIKFTVTRKHAVFWQNMLLWEPRNFIMTKKKVQVFKRLDFRFEKRQVVA